MMEWGSSTEFFNLLTERTAEKNIQAKTVPISEIIM
jgi:hypothetical protein